MNGYKVVAVYETTGQADAVCQRLKAAGFPSDDVRLTAAPLAQQSDRVDGQEDQGFFVWLFGTDTPLNERNRYTRSLQGSRAAVSARVPNELLHKRAIDIMEAANPVDLEEVDRPVPVTPPSRLLKKGCRFGAS